MLVPTSLEKFHEVGVSVEKMVCAKRNPIEIQKTTFLSMANLHIAAVLVAIFEICAHELRANIEKMYAKNLVEILVPQLYQ